MTAQTHTCNTPYGPTCWCEQPQPDYVGAIAAIKTQEQLHDQLPYAVICDVNGHVWQKFQRRYGSSWYQPGDNQPHHVLDIALPADLLKPGTSWADEDG